MAVSKVCGLVNDYLYQGAYEFTVVYSSVLLLFFLFEQRGDSWWYFLLPSTKSHVVNKNRFLQTLMVILLEGTDFPVLSCHSTNAVVGTLTVLNHRGHVATVAHAIVGQHGSDHRAGRKRDIGRRIVGRSRWCSG